MDGLAPGPSLAQPGTEVEIEPGFMARAFGVFLPMSIETKDSRSNKYPETQYINNSEKQQQLTDTLVLTIEA